MKKTKEIHSNCFFGLFYLWMRGKIEKLAFISTRTQYWPVHFLAVGRGKVYHFGMNDLDGNDVPWWYRGSFFVMSEEEARELAKEKGREIFGVVEFRWYWKLALVFLLLLLFVPWIVGWTLWPFGWCLYWIWESREKIRKSG